MIGMTVALAVLLVLCVVLWYRSHMRAQRIRMNLACLVNMMYLDEKHVQAFARTYEALFPHLPHNLDRGTRAAYCAKGIESMAHTLVSETPCMLFLGYSRAQYADVGRRAAAAVPQPPNPHGAV